MLIYLANTQWVRMLLLVLPQLLISSVLWSASSHRISYPDAVRLALNNNPKIGMSSAEIDLANAAIAESRGAGLPKLNLELNGAQSNNPLNVFGYKLSQGNASFADFGAQQYTGINAINTRPQALNHPGYYNNFNSGFKLTVPIYSGGKASARLEGAKALLRAAHQGDQSARMQLAYNVLEAYEGVLAANKIISIAKENVQAATTYRGTTQALLKQSVVIESDLLLADNYLRAAKTSLLSARIQAQNHLDEFQTLIGRQQQVFVPGNPVYFSITQKKIEGLLHDAVRNNSQLRAIKSIIEANRANISSVKSASKPQVNLQLRQDWNGNSIGSGLPSNLIALGVDWQLLSSGEQSGAINKAVAEVKKASFQFEDALNILRLSIIQAKRAEELAKIEYENSQANTTQGRNIVTTLKKRYGRGLVPLGSVLESQIKLTQAQSQSIQSQYNQKLAQGRLLLLTNQLIPHADK
jgi:outer membrane protein TolC